MSDTKKLSGKVALVTGAVNGIGLAAAEKLHAEGAVVVLTDIFEPDSALVLDRLAQFGTCVHYQRLDVANEADWDRVRGFCEKEFGQLDILVNNAGIGTMGDVTQITLADWNKVISVNLTGVFLGTQKMADLLTKAGKTGSQWSSIVNISSILGMVAWPSAPAYSASKGAVRNFTKASALDFIKAGRNIRVNSVHPGFTRTPMLEKSAATAELAGGSQANQMIAQIEAATPMGRMAFPEEIAAAIFFLASNDSSYMTGSELVVDGGFLIR